MPQFDVSTYISQIFWLFVSFSILYIFIYKIFYKNILLIKKTRADYIENLINTKSLLTVEAEKMNDNYQIIMSKIMDDIKKSELDIITKLNVELDNTKNKTEQSMLAFKEECLKECNNLFNDFDSKKLDIITNLSTTIITKITSESIDFKLLNKCIKNSIN